jgi:hypothetical protein
MCVIRRAAEGRLSKTKNVLQFTTEEFSKVAAGIRESMLKYVASPELDEYEFLPRMQAHHDKCL